MANLLEHDDAVEQEGQLGGERRMDPGAAVLLAEVEGIIAHRLEGQGAAESEMAMLLDGVPTSIVLMAADRLAVTVTRGVWRIRRRP